MDAYDQLRKAAREKRDQAILDARLECQRTLHTIKALRARIWDAKRPITTELLSALSLDRLAEELDRSSEFEKYCSRNPWAAKQSAGDRQAILFQS